MRIDERPGDASADDKLGLCLRLVAVKEQEISDHHASGAAPFTLVIVADHQLRRHGSLGNQAVPSEAACLKRGPYKVRWPTCARKTP